MTERLEYLTVPEVMSRLQLGRTTVYEQARLYLATGGTEGIPCRRFGRSLRFPAAAFETTAAPNGAPRAIERPQVDSHDQPHSTQRPRRPTRHAAGTGQTALPFTD